MSIGAILLALIVGVVACVLGEDAKTLVPRLSESMLRRASKRLAQDIRDDFLEEWLAHMHETPELTRKLWHAISVLLWGAARVDSEARRIDFASEDFEPDYAQRAFDILLGVWGLFVAFAFVVSMLVACRVLGSRLFVSKEFIGRGGRPIRIWQLSTNTRSPRLNKFLKKTTLYEIPYFFSLLKGDLTSFGPPALELEDAEKVSDPRFFELKPGITDIRRYDGFTGVGQDRIQQITSSAAQYREKRSIWLSFKLLVYLSVRLAIGRAY